MENKGRSSCAENDRFFSIVDNVIIRGTNADDSILGSNLRNRLYGGKGDDYLEGREGNDYLDGGLGNDFISYASSAGRVEISLINSNLLYNDAAGDAINSIENLVGTKFDDFL